MVMTDSTFVRGNDLCIIKILFYFHYKFIMIKQTYQTKYSWILQPDTLFDKTKSPKDENS